MQRMLLFLVLFSISNIAFSQSDFGSVKVQVFDENEKPYLGANVKVLENNVFIRGKSTDFEGVATLHGLQPGEYNIEVGAIGYSRVIYLLQISSDHESKLEINLEFSENSCFCGCFIRELTPMIHDAYGASTVFKTEQILRMPVNR